MSVVCASYMLIDYPDHLRDQVAVTEESWKAFCSLDTQTKLAAVPYEKEHGRGYEFKDGSGKSGDFKENIDVKKSLVLRPDSPEEVVDFVTRSQRLLPAIRSVMRESARKLDQVFGIPDLEYEVDLEEDAFFIRFIHYHPGLEPGQELATPHIDKGGFTLHLHESAPGLQYLLGDFPDSRKWVDLPVPNDQTMVLPGFQLQLRTRGGIDATCHRVVATPETSRDGRYSAVCFVDLPRTPQYDKDKWGRLQEFRPGFNYGLRYGAIRQYFRAR